MSPESSSMKNKILAFLQASENPLSPFSISKGLKYNPGSVRARLAELADSGQVERVTRGLYQYVPRDGVGIPGRIQNFLATVDASPPLSRERLGRLANRGILERRGNQFYHVYKFTGPPGGEEGEVRQTIQLGVKRNKITWRIRAPLGLDYYGIMFAYGLLRCTLARIGQDPGLEFMVKNIELLDDKVGTRIEGIQAVTFTDFKGNLEKLYNKAYGVRREVRDTEARPASEILALYSGGLPSFMIAQASYDIARRVQENSENIGRLASQVFDQNKINQAILEALYRLLDK